MDSISTYDLIKKSIGTYYYPIYSHPLPTSQDYINGYFDRYFYKKINAKNFIEITEKDYNMVLYNSFCQTLTFKWIIIGARNNIVVNNVLEVMGVEEQNKEILAIYPQLKTILINFLEFWQGY